jgi:hypothetical protein
LEGATPAKGAGTTNHKAARGEIDQRNAEQQHERYAAGMGIEEAACGGQETNAPVGPVRQQPMAEEDQYQEAEIWRGCS